VQRLRIVERCLHVFPGTGNRLFAEILGAEILGAEILRAEILGAGANRCTELLDLSRGLLRAGEVKVIAAFDIWLAARPWTCHLSRAILTIR
jgi:hypothetical protein